MQSLSPIGLKLTKFHTNFHSLYYPLGGRIDENPFLADAYIITSTCMPNFSPIRPVALANAADAVESGGKSPVSALNELGVRVNYTVLRQGGPAHCPSFTVAVTVADMTFEGWGHSKREARASAARACLAALLARAGRVLPAPAPGQDFTSDEPAHYPVSEFQCLETKMRPPPSVTTIVKEDSPTTTPPPSITSPATVLFGATNAVTVLKSPINVLYENYPGLSFNCTFGDGSPLDATQAPLQLSHSMRFKVVCQIKEQKFEGYGDRSKITLTFGVVLGIVVLN
ncbi:hypothetical protein evm_013972 [Chilo suppressalis]|nr:hypothetical protein evm_013972 [Chilo suppressalis]